ncbi:MAG TPA: N-acetyl-alpha-D-glucosaminyl L-malate synthase BshA, partial [Segetibacter sp.]
IHGVTGCLSNIGDVEDMSRNAIEILGSDERLAIFKKNAYEQALKFDIHNIVPVYEKLYSRVCSMQCSV